MGMRQKRTVKNVSGVGIIVSSRLLRVDVRRWGRRYHFGRRNWLILEGTNLASSGRHRGLIIQILCICTTTDFRDTFIASVYWEYLKLTCTMHCYRHCNPTTQCVEGKLDILYDIIYSKSKPQLFLLFRIPTLRSMKTSRQDRTYSLYLLKFYFVPKFPFL